MRFSAATLRAFTSLTLVLSLVGCSGTPMPQADGGHDATLDGTVGDVGTDAPSDVSDDVGPQCRTDQDCTDHIFCNGAERCSPGAGGADLRGCLAADPAAACASNQRCDEAAQMCRPDCGPEDQDGDGHRSMACGGDDCDDNDPNRFPGRTETCDPMNHDEDCDARSFGFRDSDGDGYADSQCCNTDSMGMQTCGDDCNDSRPTMHPGLVETCDGLDNDCNGMVDEGLVRDFYPDTDGDGFGDPGGTTRSACAPPTGFVDDHTDCDDTRAPVHPGATEMCDVGGLDEDCDGTANPAALCDCTGDISRPCALPGACAAGTQRCVSGSWGACSITPVAEVCNGQDDDCDGTTDEMLLVQCYADRDNDGYPETGATSIQSCPIAGRETVGGCPSNQTNRAPMGSDIDCDDTDSAIGPGATETCNGIDDNCDGVIDEGLRVMCYSDVDNDGFAAAMTPVMMFCPVAGRATYGGCPSNQTNIPPAAGNIDCADMDIARHPGAIETCNTLDDDCDGMTDEGVQTTYYHDGDMDGYGDLTMPQNACVQPANYVANSGDCNDGNAAIHPGAPEICDMGMLDENCDGVANPSSLCTCTIGTTPRMCALPGACAMGTQQCVSGSWGPCSITPRTETCNNVDDDCDGLTDEGLQVNCYPDLDNDTYAAAGAALMPSCPDSARAAVGNCPVSRTNRPPVSPNIDCNDAVAARSPAAPETCNGVDDDCDGMVDEGVLTAFYPDGDGDGCGAPTGSVLQCTPPTTGRWTTNNSDCNDTDARRCTMNPEICDGIDNNCNGRLDGPGEDDDMDGYGDVSCGGNDCNDGSGLYHPGATELCDRLDYNCSSGGGVAVDEDNDNDGFASTTAACAGGTLPRTDCNDAIATTYPSATELCDGVDNDCDGTIDDGAASWCTVQAHATTGSTCGSGRCAFVCTAPWANCDTTSANGCETDTSSNVLNCGACGRACVAGVPCVAGICNTVTDLSLGSANFTCATRGNGTGTCWGSQDFGHLANGMSSAVAVPSPTPMVGGIVDWAEVEVGTDFGCGRRATGAVYCWGYGSGGQLGNGTSGATGSSNTPVQVTGITNAIQISAGDSSACAVLSTGATMCWGSNTMGQLGNGTMTNATTPVAVTLGTNNARDVSVGAGFACVLRSTGAVSCWGYNGQGELGNGTMVNSSVPVTVTGLADATSISAGGTFACARRATGGVVCWGADDQGQLGNNATLAGATTPQAVALPAADAQEVAAGYAHACVRRTSGALVCWGDGALGQIGDNNSLDRPTPVAVSGITTAAQVAAGSNHTCARLTNSQVWCWGRNNYGQLGNGTTTSSLVPVRVNSLP